MSQPRYDVIVVHNTSCSKHGTYMVCNCGMVHCSIRLTFFTSYHKLTSKQVEIIRRGNMTSNISTQRESGIERNVIVGLSKWMRHKNLANRHLPELITISRNRYRAMIKHSNKILLAFAYNRHVSILVDIFDNKKVLGG